MQGKPLVLLLSVLYGSAFIAGFNENLVNMALVSIMAEYGVDSVTAQWLVTGYMIVARRGHVHGVSLSALPCAPRCSSARPA